MRGILQYERAIHWEVWIILWFACDYQNYKIYILYLSIFWLIYLDSGDVLPVINANMIINHDAALLN